MITSRIKALFQFIEFLHSNIENFNQYKDLINELVLLNKERLQLKPENNFKDKLRLNKSWAEYEPKFKNLQDDLINPIKAKAIDLNLCSFGDNNFPHFIDGIGDDILRLRENIQDEYLPEILKLRGYYIEYKENTHLLLLMAFPDFFKGLGRIAEYLFDFFNDNDQQTNIETLPLESDEKQNPDFVTRAYNARFLCRKFFEKRMDHYFGDSVNIYTAELDDLKKSIKIIKSGQYAKRDFKHGILSKNDPEFWNDLYHLKKYEECKKIIENLLKEEQTNFDNAPDKDDIDFEYSFNNEKRNRQQKIKDIETVIELTNEFRDLVNDAMPNLEQEFERRLQDFKVKEAAKDEEQRKLREERISKIVATTSQDEERPQLQTNKENEKVLSPPQTENKSSELPKTLEQLFGSQNLLIPKVPIKDVYEHFKILTEQTNKFNDFYLTKEQLFIFIKSTFIDKKPVKQKLKSFIKKDIRTVFYKFYFNNMNNEGNHTRLKRKYFNIMNDAFEGFNENDYTDFHKIKI
jgi:hypothetical protein